MSDTVDEIDRTIADPRVAIFEIANTSASTVAEQIDEVIEHAATVAITLCTDSETYSLTVSDDVVGVGSPGARGNGLDDLAARTHQVGGTVQVQSHPDQGTTLTWNAPRQTARSHGSRDQISEAAGDRGGSHGQDRDRQHREPCPAIR